MSTSYEKQLKKASEENSDGILMLLDSGNYQTYNREVARALGSIKAAILLSELINRYRYHAERGELFENDEGLWFYYTLEKCTERTYLSEREQRSSIKILQKYKFFEKKSMGLPAKRYFKINISEIKKFMLDSNNFSRPDKKEDLGPAKNQSYHIKNPNKEPKETTTGASPKPQDEPPDKAASEVVVFFDCLKKLDISDFKRKSLSRKYSEQHLELAVERVLRWTGRRNDEAALNTVLSRMNEWNDETQESNKQHNMKILGEISHLDGKTIKNIAITVGKDYVEFYEGSKGCYCMIEDNEFEDNVRKYLKFLEDS